MRIDELTITNFKGFEQETFLFNPHFNVVIGKNASGKTSLLDALAIMVSEYSSMFHGEQHRRIAINEIRTQLVDGQPKTQINYGITAKAHLSNIEIVMNSEILSDDLTNIANNNFIDSKTEVGITFPLIAYYGTGRLWKKHEAVQFFKQGEGPFIAYDNSLNANSSSELFLSWYKTYEDTVNKFKQPQQIILLHAFREAVAAMIPEWSDLAYNYLEDDLMGIFANEYGQINMLPFKNLSDGYRNMIGMVADMAFRCIQLNPGLKEKVITDTEGIVLIDEIDLHLHPEWQKKIVGDLKKVFPKVQFIVTTHSPFIVQSISREELIILDKDVQADTDPWRKSVEEIAEDEMQVPDVQRSEQFMEMLDIAREYFNLVKQNDNKDALRGKIDAAKRRLDELRVKFADDPAYVAMLEAQLEKTELNAAGN